MKYLINTDRNSSRKWLEASIITAVILLFTFYFNSNDPFFLKSTFPWIWFGPLFLALSYGLGPAIFSMLVMSAALFLYAHQIDLPFLDFRNYLIAGFLLIVLVGEFSSLWQSKVRHAEEVSRYIENKLDTFSHAFYILRQSHDQLEQSLISKPATLRSVLLQLRKQMLANQGQLNQDTASGLMELLVHFTKVNQGAIYHYIEEIDSFELVAKHEYLAPLNREDPLVVKALENKTTNHYPLSFLTDKDESAYLAAIPIIANGNKIKGIIVIVDMPFLSLNEENLESITILAHYYANSLNAIKASQAILTKYPNCDINFASEFYNFQALMTDKNISSYLVSIALKPSSMSENVMKTFFEQQRSIDSHWLTKGKDKDNNEVPILFSLLPFSNADVVNGYINRMKNLAMQKYQIDIDKSIVFYYQKLKSNIEPMQLIENTFKLIEKNI